MKSRCTLEVSQAKRRLAISRLELNRAIGIQAVSDEARGNSNMKRLIVAAALKVGDL